MNKLISILNCDRNYGIGKKNGLLFELPLDMAFFRKTTTGHVVAMGANTLLSFPGGKPLKNRKHIVLSKDPAIDFDGVTNVHEFEDFLKAIAEELENDTVYIIGGASIYRQMLPYVDEVYLNKVDEDGQAEVFFVNLDEEENFVLVSKGETLIDNGHPTNLCVYKNKSPKSL